MELADLFAAHDLASEADELVAHATVELALVPADTDDLPLGATRLGGGADAPDGFDWPSHRWPLDEVARWPDYARDAVNDARAKGEVRVEGAELVMPLSFVMQLDLAEVRALDPDARLPARGLLLFFASSGTDVADARFAKRVASAVRWIDAPREALRTHPQPPTPDPYPSAAVALRIERRVHLDLSWEARTALLARVASPSTRAWIEAATEPCDAVFPAEAEECVGPMPPEGCVSVLRVMDHGELGLHVGDASWVTFVMPREDLDARRFERACASVFIG